MMMIWLIDTIKTKLDTLNTNTEVNALALGNWWVVVEKI